MTTEITVLQALRQYIDSTVADSELLPFCKTAFSTIQKRLAKPGDVDDARVILAMTATAIYLYQVRLRLLGEVPLNFKAGDLSIQSGGDPLETARKLRDEYMAEAMELFKSEEKAPEPEPVPEPVPEPQPPTDGFAFVNV